MRIRCACGWELEVKNDKAYPDQLEQIILKWYVEHLQLCGDSKLHHIPYTFLGRTSATEPNKEKYNS